MRANRFNFADAHFGEALFWWFGCSIRGRHVGNEGLAILIWHVKQERLL